MNEQKKGSFPFPSCLTRSTLMTSRHALAGPTSFTGVVLRVEVTLPTYLLFTSLYSRRAVLFAMTAVYMAGTFTFGDGSTPTPTVTLFPGMSNIPPTTSGLAAWPPPQGQDSLPREDFCKG